MNLRYRRALPYDRGFTIVELLIVIAVIGALISLLIPAVNSAREHGRRATCLSQLHNQGAAVSMYLESSSSMLPALWKTSRPQPWQNFSWRAELLPFLEQQNLYQQLDFASEPLMGANLPLAQTNVEIYECPSVPQSSRKVPAVGYGSDARENCMAGGADYVGVYEVQVPAQTYAVRGAWNANGNLSMELTSPDAAAAESRSAVNRNLPASIARIRDGLGNTALVVEQAGRPDNFGNKPPSTPSMPEEGPWASGDWSTFTGDGVNVDNRKNPFAFHSVAHALMADGSAHGWSREMSPDVLRALLTSGGNEIISNDDWQ